MIDFYIVLSHELEKQYVFTERTIFLKRSMRLQRRLYGIYTVCFIIIFIIFLLFLNYTKLVYFVVKSLNKLLTNNNKGKCNSYIFYFQVVFTFSSFKVTLYQNPTIKKYDYQGRTRGHPWGGALLILHLLSLSFLSQSAFYIALHCTHSY